ncbi:MAG TPA: AI-2E family transporter [Ktedonobacterales bacterium]|nr:AI-2E family transporter [Ktedonobacterales bacterium]
MEIPDETHAAMSIHTEPAPTAAEAFRDTVTPLSRPGPWATPVRLVVAAVGALIGLWLVIELRDLLLQVLIATILAAGIAPLTVRLTRIGIPRGVSVLLVYVLVILAMVGLGFLLVPPVVGEVQSLVAQAPHFGARFVQSLNDLQRQFPFLPPLGPALQNQVKQLGNQAGAIFAQALNLIGVALGVFGGLLTVLLTMLITFYLVVDGERVRAYLLSFLPASRHAQTYRVTDDIGTRMGSWLLGQIVLSTSIGLASFIALLIVGVPSALLLAVVAAVAELIPLVGPWIAAVPAVAVAFTQDPLKALFTIIAYVIIQQLESNLLAPRIMGRAVQLHPLAVILGLLAGASLFGIVGALVAVPVASAIAVVLEEVRNGRTSEALGKAPGDVPEPVAAADHAQSS